MSARGARATVAAVLLMAATALTAGCGSGGDGGATPSPPRQHQERSEDPAGGAPSPEPREENGRSQGNGKGEADGTSRAQDDPKVAKVPEARLTPATGSFTAKEKRYLVDRVPEGLEPAAVLEAGDTACARIRATAQVSEKDAVSALRAGEIDNAEAAVEHLCPRFAPLLKKAGKGD